MDASPSSSAGWTNEEKISLLFSIIGAGGPIDWAKVEPPRGRSMESCMHLVDNAKMLASGSGTEKAGKQDERANRKRKRSAVAETNGGARFIYPETDEEARTVSSFFSTGQRIVKHHNAAQNPANDTTEDDAEEPSDEDEEEEEVATTHSSNASDVEDAALGFKVSVRADLPNEFTPINKPPKIQNAIYEYTPLTPRKSEFGEWLKRIKLTPRNGT